MDHVLCLVGGAKGDYCPSRQPETIVEMGWFEPLKWAILSVENHKTGIPTWISAIAGMSVPAGGSNRSGKSLGSRSTLRTGDTTSWSIKHSSNHSIFAIQTRLSRGTIVSRCSRCSRRTGGTRRAIIYASAASFWNCWGSLLTTSCLPHPQDSELLFSRERVEMPISFCISSQTLFEVNWRTCSFWIKWSYQVFLVVSTEFSLEGTDLSEEESRLEKGVAYNESCYAEHATQK